MPSRIDEPLVREPVYLQLHERLRGFVFGSRYKPGDQFLTEREIAERFGVSRPTANKALANLVVEGLLEFRKGLGTFVNGEALGYDLKHLVSFTEQAQAQGKVARTEVIAFRKQARAEGPAVEALRGPVYFIERLRFADEVPVIHEYRYVAKSVCPNLKREDATASLYAAWTDRHGLRIVGADETIRAVNLTEPVAARLAVPVGSAALVVEATGYVAPRVPLWWEVTTYRADAYEFRNRIGGIARPAAGQLTDRSEEKS